MITIHYTPMWKPKARNFSWAKHVSCVDMSMPSWGCFYGALLTAGENLLPHNAVVIEREPIEPVSDENPHGVWTWRLGRASATGLEWLAKESADPVSPAWIPYRGEASNADNDTFNSCGWKDSEFSEFVCKVHELLPSDDIPVSRELTYWDRKCAMTAHIELMKSNHPQLRGCAFTLNGLLTLETQ